MPMRTPRLLPVLLLSIACTAPAARVEESVGDQLGTVRFDVSGGKAARAHVVRGVKLLHHMMYPEADRSFAAALAEDPRCALAHWGRAMAILHPLWPDAPTAAGLQRGADHIRAGQACADKTPRESAYLETLGTYFLDATPEQHVERLSALDAAASALAERYPEDLDALAFSALFHLAPARFQPKDKSNRIQLEAASRLQRVLAEIPDHPGGQHYKIHAYDFPMLADRALEVCEAYGGIAPDVPHALHMPTHIYTRRGQWDKSIELNRRSADAARTLAQAGGALNSHLPHALDYMAYAYCQRGQFREAEHTRAEVLSLTGPYEPVQRAAMAFAFAAIPARCALEQKRWGEAAALPLRQPATFPWGDAFLNCDSIVRFARALGAARSGELDSARAEIAELEQVFRKLAATRRASYWASQAETQLLAARAWVAHAEGRTGDALPLMRRAVDLEASIDKEAVTPGEVLPAGDLLGDMLLEAGKPAEALEAFEAVLAGSPNRLNTLYGAALAAEKAGQPARAKDYFRQVLAVASEADGDVPQVQHARTYLAAR